MHQRLDAPERLFLLLLWEALGAKQGAPANLEHNGGHLVTDDVVALQLAGVQVLVGSGPDVVLALEAADLEDGVRVPGAVVEDCSLSARPNLPGLLQPFAEVCGEGVPAFLCREEVRRRVKGRE